MKQCQKNGVAVEVNNEIFGVCGGGGGIF